MKPKRKVFIINGYPGSGKTTFNRYCEAYLNEKYPSYEIELHSVIDPIKEIAFALGWNGLKDLKGRNFLASLKFLLDEYNNYTHKYIDEILDKNYKGKRIILFDAREVDDIQYIENEYMGISIFIDRESAKIEDELLNFADANVEDYNYNIIFTNNLTEKELKYKAESFIDEIVRRIENEASMT